MARSSSASSFIGPFSEIHSGSVPVRSAASSSPGPNTSQPTPSSVRMRRSASGKMQPLLARGESGGRSLMVATDWLAKKMYELGYIQRLDKQALKPALSHLDPDIKAPSSDPNWTFSIPWQGGMTGLIVNKKLAPDVRSVNAIFDPKYKGKVEIVSELREVVPLIM